MILTFTLFIAGPPPAKTRYQMAPVTIYCMQIRPGAQKMVGSITRGDTRAHVYGGLEHKPAAI